MMQLCAKTPPFSGYMGGDKEGGNEPYLQETDLTLKYGSSWPLGQVKNRVIGELKKMAEDKGYGSGKSRSAANSAARRDKAESANLRKKNVQKVASKPFQKQALASVGKQAAAGFNIGGRQYLETGVSTNKLAKVFEGMVKAGDKYSLAQKLSVRSRLAAKIVGKKVSSSINFYGRNFDNARFPVNSRVESRMAGASNKRIQSESVFPRVTKKGK